MSRSLALAGLGILLVSAALDAAGPPAPGGGYDLIFRGEAGSRWIRLRILVHGKALETLEANYHRQLFNFYDANKSGFLTPGQAERAVSGDPLERLLAPGSKIPLRLADLDSDGDGKISPDELARYCRSRQRFLRFEKASFQNSYANSLTRALFSALDTNKDGKLSRAEVKSAARVLADFDIDEDECIVPLELVPSLFTARRSESKKREVPSSSFLLVQPGESNQPLPKRVGGARTFSPLSLVVRGEGLGVRGLLSFSPLPCTQGTLTGLGVRGGFCLSPLSLVVRGEGLGVRGLLSFSPLPCTQGTLTGWGVRGAFVTSRLREKPGARAKVDRPHLEVTISLGDEVKPDDSVVVNSGKSRGVAGRLVVRLGKQEVDLATGPAGEPRGQSDPVKQFVTADRERRGFVRVSDLSGAEQKSLRRLLPLADRDGDGRLTREELNGYLRLAKLVEEGIVTLTLDAQERGWFAILDSDHDGRLSVSELNNAWRRLADEEANKSGFLTLDRSLQTFSLTFSRGMAPARGMAFQLTARKPTRKRPLWFRGMDRNGDGFVSRREFLGTKAEFDRLDRDGDGLISPEEAESGFPNK